jgi:hypothetical protein
MAFVRSTQAGLSDLGIEQEHPDGLDEAVEDHELVCMQNQVSGLITGPYLLMALFVCSTKSVAFDPLPRSRAAAPRRTG